MAQHKTIQVWDPLVRLFHWSLVMCVATAYMTPNGFMGLHVLTGSVVIGLVLFRLVWGFIGPDFALFRDFVHNHLQVINYLQSVIKNHPIRHLGHNPAGGIMVLLLLLISMGTALLGLVVYGVGEFAGPFSWLGLLLNSQDVAWLKQGHALLVYGLLLLVTLHVTGVVLTSWQHRENLIKSMFTGEKTP